MKTKLAIFDLDGTLFNTERVNYLAYNTALAGFGCKIDYEYFCKECNGKYYKEFLPAIIGCSEIKLDVIHNLKKEAYTTNLKEAKINQVLFDLIESIKADYYLAVVTTASRKNCHDILDFYEKTQLFDLILTNEDVACMKPAPEGFIKAMDYFSISSGKTIIFEDSEVGVEAAKRSGAHVFCVDKF